MDFMFEDEVDEVGSDVEAYCPKCKADTTHVVISKYEDEIRRVQCNACGDVHSFRKPRGEVEDDVPEPIAAKKRASVKKLSWDEFFVKHGEKPAKPYEFRERYSENTIVTHPKFGKGFVSEIISDSKVEISFKDGRRVLVHNRRDLPGLPLAAEGDGVPSTGGKAKALKEKAEKADKLERAAAEKAAGEKDAASEKKAAKGKTDKGETKAEAKSTDAAAGAKAPKQEKTAGDKPEKVKVAKPDKADKAPDAAKAESKPDKKADKADKKPEAKTEPKAESKGGKSQPKADAPKASKAAPEKPSTKTAPSKAAAEKKPASKPAKAKPAAKPAKGKPAEKSAPKAKAKDKDKEKKKKKKK
jgi:hypothetical protein